MIRDNGSGLYVRRKLRSALALILMLCLLISGTAFGGTSVGGSSASIEPNLFVRPFIKLSKSVVFFTGETYGTGSTIAPAAGTVWQLLSDDYYTSPNDKREYYCVYYQSRRYNVLKSDVEKDIMSDKDLTDYVKKTLWAQPTFETLKKDLDLIGDVRVYGLQYALSSLGYYDGALDGDYGDKTADAVRKFQRENGLDTDGRAGPITQTALYKLLGGTGGGGTGTGGSTGSSTSGGVGTLRTTVSVNLRKSTSTRSTRLAVVPRGVSLAYSDTSVKSGVTWYKVNYNSETGWLMGTFVSAGGTIGGGGGTIGGAAIGKVTITAPGTRVRKTPNGQKTGTVLARGTIVDLLAQPVSAGGYSWYNIRTIAGLVGFVRGDCADATIDGGGGGGVTPTTAKTFIKLPAATSLFTTESKPASGGVMVSAGTVLQMVSTATYQSGSVTYCSLYYNNTKYNAVYNEVKAGILSDKQLGDYVMSLWNSPLSSALKQEFELVGDVRVYAMQLALKVLGYYTGNLDGVFGSGSASAVRNYQRKNSLEVDGSCGNLTWAKLTANAKLVSDGTTTGSGTGGGGTGGGGTGGGTTVLDFGTINSIEKATWTKVNDESTPLFKKGSSVKVMDVATGRVFQIFRWSGGKHADCVPLTANDTRIMCEIVGFPYNNSHPTNDQLNKIKADSKNDNSTYTWPDFGNGFRSGMDIKDAWDRRPALLNVDGRVFCVSIYGYPHGFNGTDAFATSRFPDGSLFYTRNNYYGMMCVHFVDSTTHSGTTPDKKHQESIEQAYDYAKRHWPTLCK